MSRPTRSPWPSRAGAAVPALFLACAPAAQSGPEPASAAGPAGTADAGAKAALSVPGHVVAEVPRGTFGPYVGEAGPRRVLVWSTPGDDRADGAWWTRALDVEGHPRSDSTEIAKAPDGLGLVAVRASRLEPGAEGAA
ncbi:MAG TPA: hypothetical protein VF989_19990, partial [Polyangiaceae bacterium]